MSIVRLPVSLGEALDKLTILDIKVEKIQDPIRKQECRKEYEMLYSELNEYILRFQYWYKTLRAVNADIWDFQDTLRDDPKDNNNLANSVLSLNDMRFRIKNRINIESASTLKEQKGYGLRNAIITTPINLISFLQNQDLLYALAMYFDNLFVVCDNEKFLTLTNTIIAHPFLKCIALNELNSEDRESCMNIRENATWKEVKFHRVFNIYDRDRISKEFGWSASLLKAFTPTKGLFLTHLGLGDIINMHPAVHYLSKEIDEIYVVTFANNFQNTKDLFMSNPKVRILSIDRKEEASHWNYCERHFLLGPVVQLFDHTFFSGIYKNSNRNIEDVPRTFYKDLGLDINISKTCRAIPRLASSNKLYQYVKDTPYIFVHDQTSGTAYSIITWDIYRTLTINPNTNLYKPGESFYEVAEHFVNKPIFDYVDTMEHARELHILDSSFFCISLFLDLTNVAETKCYNRYTQKSMDNAYDLLKSI